jgi:hypothetical protein
VRPALLGSLVTPGQSDDVDPEYAPQVAENGVAVDSAQTAFDLGQPGLRSADQPGHGGLAQTAAAPVEGDTLADRVHHRLIVAQRDQRS